MSFDRVLLAVMAFFSVIAALDRILGCPLKLGQTFDEGILALGSLALSMIGIMVLTPLLAAVLGPVVIPVFTWMGADPSMFAGLLLGCDMGGAQLAAELSNSPEAARLAGCITCSMLGGTVSFTIPMAMRALKPEDQEAGALGILCGVVTIPLGVVTGGLVCGIPLGMILINTVPVLVISGLIALGLWKAKKQLIKGFSVFGKCISALAILGLAAAGVEWTTGVTLIPGLGNVQEAFQVIGQIAIVLTGALPLVQVLRRVLKKPFAKLGGVLGISETSVSGLLASLANSIPTMELVKDMDYRGKVLNMAFAVSAAFVFGDHLAFFAGFDPVALPGMIAGKLAAGISAVALACLMTKRR